MAGSRSGSEHQEFGKKRAQRADTGAAGRRQWKATDIFACKPSLGIRASLLRDSTACETAPSPIAQAAYTRQLVGK